MTQVMTALRGGPAPESLHTFMMEQEFWQRIGENRVTLLKRPAREVEDYTLFIELILRQEQTQANTPHQKGGRRRGSRS